MLSAISIARSTLRPSTARAFAIRAASVHTLPDLPYAYDALEPHISAEIMALHHTKHHQAYVAGYEETSKKLEVVTTANQDPLISHVPIIGVDIWEHAFYLQYKNAKPDYLHAIWNVINFEKAKKRFLAVAK